jgi:hypothetical protein
MPSLKVRTPRGRVIAMTVTKRNWTRRSTNMMEIRRSLSFSEVKFAISFVATSC